ncbi:MAG TPA: hypothetical protein PLY46_09465 [Bacteroidales bacterium]|nr:hypothetical protein [Bacteroidales bacterium]
MEETKFLKTTALPRRLAVTISLIAMMLVLGTQKSSAQTAVASNSGPVCTGGAVTLYETGGSAVSWLWSSSGAASFNDNSLQNPVATGAVNGEIFTVQITDAGGNTASATTTVIVYAAPPVRPGPISGEETQCRNSVGVVYSINPVVNATSYLWEVPAGVEITSGQGTLSITVNIGPSAPASGTIRVYAINACASSPPRSKDLKVIDLPAAPGSITGSSTFTYGATGVPYTVGTVTGATSYVWSYSGTGVIINGNGSNNVTLDFSSSASAGQLSVRGLNACGEGSASSMELTAAAKTLLLSSVMLEGLYIGASTMRQARNATGPQYEAGVADHITIELHDATNYATVVWSLPDVSLSTSGTAEINIPAVHNGSYYITVRHRNSIATTTALPVSFAGTSVSYSFGSASAAYFGNLKLSRDGVYLVFGADVNQDGIVDTGDMNWIDNGSAAILRGYNAADATGDGIVDTSDMNLVDNNSAAIVRVRRPN